MHVPSEGNNVHGVYAWPIVAEALRAPLLRLQLLCESPETSHEAVGEARSLLRLFDAVQFASARAAHTQQQLDLEPLCLKPLFDDIVHQLEPLYTARKINVENRLSHQPVLAHRLTTAYATEHLFKALLELSETNDDQPATLTLHDRTYDDRHDVGLYHGSTPLRAADVASMRSKTPAQPNIHFRLAETLLSFQGSTLRSSIFKKQGGLAFSVVKSRQLSLTL